MVDRTSLRSCGAQLETFFVGPQCELKVDYPSVGPLRPGRLPKCGASLGMGLIEDKWSNWLKAHPHGGHPSIEKNPTKAHTKIHGLVPNY